MEDLMTSATWQELQAHFAQLQHKHMKDWFANDPERCQRFSLEQCGIFLDYSKNRILPETMKLLFQLAESAQISQHIEQLFTGGIVNPTEKRPALHTALRDFSTQSIRVGGEDIKPQIHAMRDKMKQLCEQIHSGIWKGVSGDRITDIVNLGVGGSDLGPRMMTLGLTAYHRESINIHYISEVDEDHFRNTMTKLNPKKTLFIISSKSFTTVETMINAHTAKEWMGPNTLKQHFLAVTAKPDEAIKFGISPDNILPLWDWVGGRYSVWSAIGLPLALAIGMNNFEDMLRGAYAMDKHFRTSPLSQNMPVILALLSLWYCNFFHASTRAILPYNQYLKYFPDYLSQLVMESNGKRVNHDGNLTNILPCPIIWGELGGNAQHSFYQLFHQGSQLVPIDFILSASNPHWQSNYNNLLFSSCLGQSLALLNGKSIDDIIKEMQVANFSPDEIKRLTPHKFIPGNKPHNILLLDNLSPAILGSLLALYEHVVYVQGTLSGINPFDQWGVELGKQFTTNLMADLIDPQKTLTHDSSTNHLIQRYRNKATS